MPLRTDREFWSVVFGANTFDTASGTLNLAVDTTTYGPTATWDQSTGTLVLVVAASQGYAIGVLKSVSFEVQNVGHDQNALTPTIMATIAAGANIPSSDMVVSGLNTVRGTLTNAYLFDFNAQSNRITEKRRTSIEVRGERCTEISYYIAPKLHLRGTLCYVLFFNTRSKN